MRPADEPAAPEVLSRNRLGKGALVFVVLTAAGIVGLFALGASDVPRVPPLHVGFLLAALASALGDVVLGAVRFQIFIRRVRPGSPLWLPVRADLAGRFVGAVTPSQSGGGPAQVFVLHRGGIPVPEALSFLLLNLISTLLFSALAGGFAAWLFRDHFGEGALLRLTQYGFVVVLALLGVMVAALVRPDLVSRPLERLARRLGRGKDGPPTTIRRIPRLLADSLEDYRAACHRFVRGCPWLPAASFALTILIYLNKFGLAWLVMRGLGVERDFAITVALMALVHFSVFLAPSPGGSGIAELATGGFVSILLPSSLVGPFTLAYRLLLVYLPAAAGAVALWDAAGVTRRRSSVGRSPRTEASVSRLRSPWPRGARLGLTLALSLGAASGASGAIQEGSRPCPLCGETAPATTPLVRAEVEAAAASLAERNRRELDRIGALLREGRLGPPRSREARERAQLLARLALGNWYSFLLPFVTDPRHVWRVSPEAIAPVVARYCEATVVPMPRLRELRLGRGHVCARYDLAGSHEEGSTVLGGRRLRYRVRDVAIDGLPRRLLGLDWGSAGSGKVELLVDEHYGFRLVETRLPDRDGGRCDLLLALDVSGGWVRRFGVHRPAAFAYWATRPREEAPYLPRTPRVGSAIYLPGLRLCLPLAPDIGFDDVRMLGLPMPFLAADDLRRGALPPWLPSDGGLGLPTWKGQGPVPAVLREYFPDL